MNPATSQRFVILPLPANFAEQVLQLEGSLDILCSLNSVKKLIELYTWAVEYYEAQENPIFSHYRSRMQTLFMRRDVRRLLGYPSQKSTQTASETVTSNLYADRSAEKSIQLHKHKSNKALRKMQDNLKSQCMHLDKRIVDRKNSRHGEENGEALSLEGYEEQVQSILEWFVKEKDRIQRQIEGQYQQRIEEMGEMGEYSSFDAVLDGLKKRMKAEIEEACVGIERSKKGRMAELRARINISK